MTVLDCQHISKSFDGVPVLRDLAFGIEKGSKTALIGVNGAGKTTWMRIVTGQMEPDAGQVVIDKNLRIGYLAQDRQGIDINSKVDNLKATHMLPRNRSTPLLYLPSENHMTVQCRYRTLVTYCPGYATHCNL